LLWSFARIRNVYPIATWNVMMAAGDPQRGRTYFVLRGETLSGGTIDIRAMGLTNALFSRTWGMVTATAGNESFKLASPHPLNVSLMASVGGIENLPQGARLPDLLQAWGRLYNNQQPPSSPLRLKAIRLNMYSWDSGRYADYDRFLYSWRKEL
jgi:hypothetical protein